MKAKRDPRRVRKAVRMAVAKVEAEAAGFMWAEAAAHERRLSEEQRRHTRAIHEERARMAPILKRLTSVVMRPMWEMKRNELALVVYLDRTVVEEAFTGNVRWLFDSLECQIMTALTEFRRKERFG
jgi:hypothetical protein